MKTLYLFFAMALGYFGWSYTSWEASLGNGGDAFGPTLSSEFRMVDSFPR